ncbi:hypothetical protein [Nocardioides sp. zg-1228]|uniref:hypothetical protein n=1 Tax=Nocardioides sp. zg-1228 TaxID=2763008 RepID=UPI0016428334|nr:hypothetical protein [Nocardioides sp. zg-1228]MBC2934044.1 hypothetical protein [Nocardioides sp. zg-1228]QSF58798.1 hypothetical protein JX575_06345 [Nocardioides sp. zg-1228]
MSTTPGAGPAIEDRLRAALAARAELVRPEDLAPPAPVAPLRPRWRSPWVLLATAAAVLLVLGIVVQGLGRDTRSDDVAPRPDAPEVELPADVGRDWKADDLSSPARLDLDGDGVKEKVQFLAERTKDYDGRIRIQTIVSSTGREAYGIAELGSTIGTTALEPVDADGDGDQELVLYYDDLGEGGPGGLGHPLVFDLRAGLLVQAVPEEPDLLVRGYVPVGGSETEHYRMVHLHDYWIEDGELWSSRSVDAYAEGGMSLLRPETIVVDAWRWGLDDDGVLRATGAGCLRMGLGQPSPDRPCGDDTEDALPDLAPASEDTFGPGEGAAFDIGYRFTARIEAGAPPVLVVEGGDGTARHRLDVADPRVSTVQPASVLSDGAALVVTSASDPSRVQVVVQDGDRLRVLVPTGEIALTADGTRTWLTTDGDLVSTVEGEDGTWGAWRWQMVSGTEMAALPWGTVCLDDVDDPTTARSC